MWGPMPGSTKVFEEVNEMKFVDKLFDAILGQSLVRILERRWEE